MKPLPDEWLKPKHAKPLQPDTEAWRYGDERGISVHIYRNGIGSMSASIPKRMLLKWADDMKKRG